MTNRKPIDITNPDKIRKQLPRTAHDIRIIVWEVETIFGEPRRTVFDLATFCGLLRYRSATKFLRQLQDRSINPLEVVIEY